MTTEMNRNPPPVFTVSKWDVPGRNLISHSLTCPHLSCSHRKHPAIVIFPKSWLAHTCTLSTWKTEEGVSDNKFKASLNHIMSSRPARATYTEWNSISKQLKKKILYTVTPVHSSSVVPPLPREQKSCLLGMAFQSFTDWAVDNKNYQYHESTYILPWTYWQSYNLASGNKLLTLNDHTATYQA